MAYLEGEEQPSLGQEIATCRRGCCMPSIKLEADRWVAAGFKRLSALLVRWSPMVFP